MQPYGRNCHHLQQATIATTACTSSLTRAPVSTISVWSPVSMLADNNKCFSQAAMAQVLAGQQLVLRNRPDAAFFADQEQEALHSVQHLLPK